MIAPTKAEIVMSMLEREVPGAIKGLIAHTRFARHAHLVDVGANIVKEVYGDDIKTFLEAVTKSDTGIDACAGEAKDCASSFIDGFAARVKKRISESCPPSDTQGVSDGCGNQTLRHHPGDGERQN